MKKFKKNWEALSDEEKCQAMKAIGVEEEAEEAAPQGGDAEELAEKLEHGSSAKKIAEAKKAIMDLDGQINGAEGLCDVLDHMAAKGFCTIVKHSAGVNADSPEGLVECTKALGIDVTPPAPVPTFDGAEMAKSLSATFDAKVAEIKDVYAEAVKSLGADVTSRFDALEAQVEKAMHVPALPRDVKPGTVARVGGKGGNGKFVPGGAEMRKSLNAAFATEKDSERRREIGDLILELDANQPLERAALDRLNITAA